MTLELYIKKYLKDLYSTQKEEVNYRDGCLMTAAQYLYEATGNAFYKNVILDFGAKYVSDDGTLLGFDPKEFNVDKIRFGTALFFLHKETGQERYNKAIETMMDNLQRHPRTSNGCFWHKQNYPHQVWLDGVYMVMPFILMYNNTRGEGAITNKDVINEFKHIRDILFNKSKRLYHHAWDESIAQVWADKQTGLSPNFWLRAMGWLLMAMVDCYELLQDDKHSRNSLQEMLQECIDGLLPYRDATTRMFYQLVDLPQQQGNYIETSGSLMFAYAIKKGLKLNMLTDVDKYAHVADEILISVQANMLPYKDGKLSLKNICGAAGLGEHPIDGRMRDGSVAYYLSEPIVEDSPLGATALMMLYAQGLS